jgi:hypothetical protein
MPSSAPRQPRITPDQQLSPDAPGAGASDAGLVGEPRRLLDPPRRSASALPSALNTLSASLPTVLALLAIDALVGVWAYLNAPGFLPSLSLANVLVVGIGSVTGLLPKKDREKLRETLERIVGRTLASDVVRRGLVLVFLLLLVVSLVTANILMQSDGNAGVTAHILEGSQSRSISGSGEDDTVTISRANPIAVSRHLVIRWGKPVWAHTTTHVTKRDGLLYPWRPLRWTYPEDFDEMVTLYVLPTTSADLALDLGKPSFILRDADSLELFRAPLRRQGVRVRYAPHGQPEKDGNSSANDRNALALAWTRAYTELDNRDSSVIVSRVRQWMQADTAQPRRPLHLHEKVIYEIRFENGTRRGPFQVVLASNPFHLLVDSSKVDELPPPSPR